VNYILYKMYIPCTQHQLAIASCCSDSEALCTNTHRDTATELWIASLLSHLPIKKTHNLLHF